MFVYISLCGSQIRNQIQRSKCSHLFASTQDQRVPTVVFHYLHAAAVEVEFETQASKLLVKKWISVLVRAHDCALRKLDVILPYFYATDQAQSVLGGHTRRNTVA